MIKKKNNINLILNNIKVDLTNYLLYIDNISKNKPELNGLIISTKSCIQNIFFKIRNHICKINFVNNKEFKCFNFHFQKIKNKINNFLEDLEIFILKNNNTLENLEDKKVNMSNFCYLETNFSLLN
jgi:hypothetical protein